MNKLFHRSKWNEEYPLIKYFKKIVMILWLVYFTLEIKSLRPIFKVIKKVVNIPLILWIYERRIQILLLLTAGMIIEIIIIRILKHIAPHANWQWTNFFIYQKISKKKFPQYSTTKSTFHNNLVKFLNIEYKPGNNIYWLDGKWGSGKTHFIKIFFEEQKIKKSDVYYVSCFGIRTREQAEKVLIREIENQSILGNFDYIPLVGGLFKWFYKIIGLDLIKKDSVIIFDDLERISSNGIKNDYNDILGFIDFLADNQTIKIIVLLNKSEIETDKSHDPFHSKFRTNFNIFPSTESIISQVINEDKSLSNFHKSFLIIYFKIQLLEGSYNLRNIFKTIEKLEQLNNEEETATIIDMLNQDTFMNHIFFYKSDIVDINTFTYNRNQKSPFLEILYKNYLDEFDEFDKSDKNYQADQELHCMKISYFQDLLKILWTNNDQYKTLALIIYYEPDGEIKLHFELDSFQLSDQQIEKIENNFIKYL